MQVTSGRATGRSGRRRLRTLAGLAAGCAVLLSLLVPQPGLARPGGIAEAKEGCLCHSNSGPAAHASLEGLPSGGYEPGHEYDLVVKALDGIPVSDPPQANLGGFALYASEGELVSVDGSTQLMDAGGRKDLVHTEAGNDQREWRAKWKAPRPAKATVEFHLSVNTVDGNADGGAGGTSGDSWATAKFESKPAGGGTTTPPAPSLGGLPVPPGAGAALLFGGISILVSIYALTLPFREKSPYREIDVTKVRTEVSRPKPK